MNKFIYILLFLFTLAEFSYCGFLPDGAFSKDARGAVSATFLKNISSARFYSMGKSGSSLSSPESIFFNPAGMQTDNSKNAFYFDYQSLFDDSFKTDFAFIRARKLFTYGFAYTRNSYGSFEKLSSKAEKLGTFSPYDQAFVFGFSKNKDLLKWGFNLKLVNSNLIYDNASSFALDFGIISRANAKREYSIYMRNLGPPMRINSQKDPLPLELGAGLKHSFRSGDFYLEGKFPSYDSPYMTLGYELLLSFDSLGLALRSGFDFNDNKELGFLGAFSLGFGAKFSGFNLDYAYNPQAELGDLHRFSVSVLFGKKDSKDLMKRAYENKIMSEVYIKSKKFVILPFKDEVFFKQYKNYGVIVAQQIGKELKEAGYNIMEPSPFEWAEFNAKNYLYEEDPVKKCGFFKYDFCVYGSISLENNRAVYNVKVFNGEKSQVEEEFLVTGLRETYDFKPAAAEIARRINER